MIFSPLTGKRGALWVCLLLAAVCCQATDEKDTAAMQWLRQNAIPLEGVEVGHGFDDLQPVGKIVGNARIVELGEATHGTREFFQMKHRMVEYLASQKGFTIFSIEANMPQAYRLNDFVLKGEGDPKQLLKGMYFWTWNTEEVLDMILWMREFNKSGKGRIEFTGFDMQTPTMPLETVRKFIQGLDMPYFSATVNPLYNDALHIDQSFAGSGATLPVQAVTGKHVTLSGYLRTEDLTAGYAGLWIRADGAASKLLAFSDMHDANVTGTTSWKRYEISIDVPANATYVVFGAIQSGNGTAWVDSMAIAINGVPYRNDNGDDKAIDLDFESATPRGFNTWGEGYEIAIDSTVAQSGKQSLRMKRVGLLKTVSNDQAQMIPDRCSSVIAYLEKNRVGYIQSGVAAKDVEWVIQNARLVLQYAQFKVGTKTRDESMADNIKWIADQNPNAKIVVWAHNGHISYGGYPGMKSMGSYLKTTFGSQIVNFGFAFNEGGFRAVESGKGLHGFTVEPAPEGSLDRALGSLNMPVLAIDLRRVPKDGPVAQWFAQEHASRSIGAAYSDTLAPNLWNKNPANQDFDALLFIEKTTAAHGNP